MKTIHSVTPLLFSLDDVLGRNRIGNRAAGLIIEFLPDLSDGHRFFHLHIQGVTLLSGVYVENLNGAITSSGSDIFIVGIETNAIGLLRGITQGVFMCNLNI